MMPYGALTGSAQSALKTILKVQTTKLLTFGHFVHKNKNQFALSSAPVSHNCIFTACCIIHLNRVQPEY